MPDNFASVNLSKLVAMKRDWEGVVSDRGLAMAKIQERLTGLVARDANAMVPAASAVEFFNAILEFGKAGGKVELLNDLLMSIGTAERVREPDSDGHHEGDFRLA